MADVVIKTEGLDLIRRHLRKTTGPVDDMFRSWGKRYLAFAARRFDRFSKGQGNWKPLAPATVRRRRKGGRKRGGSSRTKVNIKKTGGKVAILVDTGILKGALSIGAAGNQFKRTRKGMRVGFGGIGRHPKSKASIRDIAVFHDQGTRTIPQRQILVKPDTSTQNGMKRDLKKAIRRLGRMAARKS